MNRRTNEDLIIAVNKAIEDKGIKKTYIAEKLGISRQALDKLLNKKNFSLDDANKILSLLDLYVEFVIKKD